MKVRSWSNYSGVVGERSELPSQTVPDQSLSLRDLMERHKSGGLVKTFAPVYLPEDSAIPVGLERMDAIDRKAYANDLADFISTTRGKLITAREARKREADDARLRAAVLSKQAEGSASSEGITT